MEKRTLGRTDLEMTRLSFGGLFVSSFGAEFEQARSAVLQGVECGINYFDTAPGYADSEEVLGKILPEVEEPVYVSTKLGGRPDPFDPRDKEHLRASLQESLRLLGRDRIDILFIHEPDRPGQYDWFEDWDPVRGPVCEALQEFKDEGLIRYTGLGGTTAYEMAHLIRHGDFDVVLTAFNYSLLWREAEIEVLPAAREKGMGIVAGSPLQQGWLARPYEAAVRDNPPPWLSRPRREQLIELYDYVEKLEMSLPELALRWVLSNEEIDCVLSGPRSEEEIRQNVAAAEAGPLPPEVMGELDEIAALVPFRPFEEPFGCMLGNPGYRGPGHA